MNHPVDVKWMDLLSHEEWMQNRAQVYEERRERVERVCAGVKDRWVTKSPGNEFVFDVSNGLGYCRHGKVCTLWGFHSVVIFCRTFFDMFHRLLG